MTESHSIVIAFSWGMTVEERCYIPTVSICIFNEQDLEIKKDILFHPEIPCDFLAAPEDLSWYQRHLAAIYPDGLPPVTPLDEVIDCLFSLVPGYSIARVFFSSPPRPLWEFLELNQSDIFGNMETHIGAYFLLNMANASGMSHLPHIKSTFKLGAGKTLEQESNHDFLLKWQELRSLGVENA